MEKALKELEQRFEGDESETAQEIASLRVEIAEKIDVNDADAVAKRILQLQDWKNRLQSITSRMSTIERKLGEYEEDLGLIDGPIDPRDLDRPPKQRK